MKIVAALIAACSMAVSSYADLTEFQFFSSSKTDGVTSSDLVHIFLDDDAHFDMLDHIEGGRFITFPDYYSYSPIASLNPTVIPFGPDAGKWSTAFISDNSSARVGKYAFAVITDYDGFDMGDTLRIGTFGGLINEALPGGQTFDPGELIVIDEIPEPTTIGLMGIAGVGMLLARRKAHR